MGSQANPAEDFQSSSGARVHKHSVARRDHDHPAQWSVEKGNREKLQKEIEQMISRQSIKLPLTFLLATAAGASFIACSRSNGQPNSNAASASPAASVIEVSTTAAISRELPRFFEATGSLAADVQTDVQP